MTDFLILRCHPRDTLPFSLQHPHLYCPTTMIPIRRGPSRTRHLIPVPILPSFLFFPTSSPLPPFSLLSSRLHIMKRPHLHSSYAYCTLHELTIMISTHHSLSQLHSPFHIGARVIITTGLLIGTTGTITQIRNNGDITLKIQQHLGWKFNTCIVNISVLRSLP